MGGSAPGEAASASGTDEGVWRSLRTEFPAASARVYLNTAGGGCMSRSAAAAASRFYEEAVAEGDGPWDRWLDRAASARRTVARLIGVEERSIALLPNASAGLDLLQRLFDDGRDVLVVEREFPSVTLPHVNRGRRLRTLPLGPDLGIDWDTVDPALTAGAGTIALSHVGFRTGHRLDLSALCHFAQRHGLRTVVDATQSAGVLPINVGDDAAVDALVFSGYKWCGAGYGIAALYLRPEHLSWPGGLPAAGWRSAAEPYALLADSLTPRLAADALELGHPPFAGAFALDAALSLLMGVGVERIAARILALNERLHAALDRIGLPVRSPRDPLRQSGITIAAVPHAAEVVAALKRRGIVVGRRAENELRISVHAYTSENDIDRLIEALAEAAGCLDA